ncbi:MAG: class I SAM-dependent methyltransferase [Proteobacteria bacterium]|nr:class I SAM-dependent methyltransferase [Pseudomonadota bacterium]MBU4295859.1 class I SAM-dependent methyltransferase [Pseudomonadota bacterium]MCG2747883.1 class I SAM-dependent methyltransferase [Desulfobulbaceae bacterium]
MAQFEKSRWADNGFSRNYRDEAEIYLPQRRHFIDLALSFYGHFIAGNRAARILDLGCGDGLLIQQLLQSFAPEEVTLVDGSDAMLAAAKARLGERGDIRFIRASFQDLLNQDPLPGNFDFIYSSLAIHHLASTEKKDLYAYIYRHLAPGGSFVHYDVVLPCSDTLEKWYLSLWRQWITEQPDLGKREKLLLIPEQYKGNPDNVPDSLEAQLQMLKQIGFDNVDCYGKNGIFALFGGSR